MKVIVISTTTASSSVLRLEVDQAHFGVFDGINEQEYGEGGGHSRRIVLKLDI